MKFKQMSIADVYKLCGIVYPSREEEQKEIFRECSCGELFLFDNDNKWCKECRAEEIRDLQL